ncbi:beta galactosidase jelly roll domain-containing protein [bacterium]|nr:beta galactosidase jelly roll domain-containing protein [bacterium]
MLFLRHLSSRSSAALSAILLLSIVPALRGQDFRCELDFSGPWKFEIRDDPRFADPSYDDSGWETVKVPDLWENNGFPGYDGYAWYRLEFEVPNSLKKRPLFIRLGAIDDIDRTYLNGVLIGGQGEFPPQVRTAWNVKRMYRVPPECVRYGGRNVLAVRVYDLWMGGGIVEGEVGLFSKIKNPALDHPLGRGWKFATGDGPARATVEFDDSKWETVDLPAYWESCGHADYNGFAWYRKTFEIPAALAADKLILLMGRIDDADQTYLNGVMIGQTGRIRLEEEAWWGSYMAERAYYLPDDLLRRGQPNVIAVRVLDTGAGGGIYQGPIGLMTREKYLRYQNRGK